MWQDISTAPYEKEILIYVPNGFGGGFFVAERIDDENGKPVFNPAGMPYQRRATHWMPLPSPPSPVTDASAIISNAESKTDE